MVNSPSTLPCSVYRILILHLKEEVTSWALPIRHVHNKKTARSHLTSAHWQMLPEITAMPINDQRMESDKRGVPDGFYVIYNNLAKVVNLIPSLYLPVGSVLLTFKILSIWLQNQLLIPLQQGFPIHLLR